MLAGVQHIAWVDNRRARVTSIFGLQDGPLRNESIASIAPSSTGQVSLFNEHLLHFAGVTYPPSERAMMPYSEIVDGDGRRIATTPQLMSAEQLRSSFPDLRFDYLGGEGLYVVDVWDRVNLAGSIERSTGISEVSVDLRINGQRLALSARGVYRIGDRDSVLRGTLIETAPCPPPSAPARSSTPWTWKPAPSPAAWNARTCRWILEPSGLHHSSQQPAGVVDLVVDDGVRDAGIALEGDLGAELLEDLRCLLHPPPGYVGIGIAGAEENRRAVEAAGIVPRSVPGADEPTGESQHAA